MMAKLLRMHGCGFLSVTLESRADKGLLRMRGYNGCFTCAHAREQLAETHTHRLSVLSAHP